MASDHASVRAYKCTYITQNLYKYSHVANITASFKHYSDSNK